MLNKVIPKLKDNESLFDFPFDTISNRIVPKPMDTELIEEVCLCHGSLLPKLLQLILYP